MYIYKCQIERGKEEENVPLSESESACKPRKCDLKAPPIFILFFGFLLLLFVLCFVFVFVFVLSHSYFTVLYSHIKIISETEKIKPGFQMYEKMWCGRTHTTKRGVFKSFQAVEVILTNLKGQNLIKECFNCSKLLRTG